MPGSHSSLSRHLKVRRHPAASNEIVSSPEKDTSLDSFLDRLVQSDAQMRPLAELLGHFAGAAAQIAELIALGHIAGAMGHVLETSNTGGDMQKRLDIVAHDVFTEALGRAPVVAVLSEELAEPVVMDSSAPLAVAIDPLDGSSNIDANVSIGTIFSVFPAVPDATDPAQHFLRPGHEQIAAGFIIYGPHTSMVFTVGDGVHVFTLDRRSGTFRLATFRLAIPDDSIEYAVNASNYRHWNDSVRAYIDDCIQGADGPFRRDHNMRWIASLVADAYRILVHGGLFLYPADVRKGYRSGRLRLIYEANPISLLVEQASGGATDPVERILNIRPKDLHARTPIVFGSFAAVRRISQYHTDPQYSAERSPLFFQRGLIRR